MQKNYKLTNIIIYSYEQTKNSLMSDNFKKNFYIYSLNEQS